MDRICELEKEMEKMRLFQQSAMVPNNVRTYGGQQYGQQNSRTNYRQSNANVNGATELIPINPRGYRCCGLNDHHKYQCDDYQKAVREGVIHHLDPADSKAYLGPHGGGGPVVPLPEFSGAWQKVWVNDMRKKSETEAGEVANSGGAVRSLMLEAVPRIVEIGDEAPMTPAYKGTWGGAPLKVGEVRSYLALQDKDGATTGWIETKRGADEMNDSITLDTDYYRKRAKQNTYPTTRGSPRATVEDVSDDEDDVGHSVTPPITQLGVQEPREAEDEEMVVLEPNVPETGESQAPKKRRGSTAREAAQAGRRVPVKLRSEAEPEKMVDKILNQSVDGITVREVSGLSPDLLRELWGVKRLPALKGSIPAVTRGNPQETEKQRCSLCRRSCGNAWRKTCLLTMTCSGP